MTVRDSGPYYVGIDIGGTNVKVGVVDDAGRSLASVVVLTEARQGPERGLENIYRTVERAVAKSGLTLDDIHAIGIGAPGTLDIPAGMLLEPPNLPGWVNLPIRQIVSDHFGKPATFQNDANAAAYGEYWVGAGRGAGSMVMWTLGTGIGCGIIVRDMIIQGEHSHGSEAGHMVVQMDGGRYCHTGQYGTLEAYAGGKALVERCHEALQSGRESLLRDRLEVGEMLTPLAIAEAAEAGDRLAGELIMDVARVMGIGTTSLMHTIDPHVFLFGGAMTFGRHETELGRRFLERIKDEVRLRAFKVPAERTVFDYAMLGNDAGYIGAAGWARHECRRVTP